MANFAASDTGENVFEAFPNLPDEMLGAEIEYLRSVVAEGAAKGEEGGSSDKCTNAAQSIRTTKIHFSDLRQKSRQPDVDTDPVRVHLFPDVGAQPLHRPALLRPILLDRSFI